MLHVLVLAATLATGDLEGAPSRPNPIGTFTVSAFSGWPDVLGASAVLNAIPNFDIEGGAAFELFGLAATLRGGPRFMLGDWRDAAHTGFTVRTSVLGGARWLRLWSHDSLGPNVVAAVDGTYWLAHHFGLTLRLSAGAFYEIEFTQFRPDLRLGVGMSF